MTSKQYAEDLNYWRTSRASDAWIERATREIVALGGVVMGHGYGVDSEGRAAYMFAFRSATDSFKIVWPVMPSRTRDTRAAQIQAATTLYHYIKAVCLYAAVIGPRAAFFSHLLLPDGRMAVSLATGELANMAPVYMLTEGGR